MDKMIGKTDRQEQPTPRSRARALFLSPDFIVGILAGAALGLVPAILVVLRTGATSYVLTLAVIDAAVAALVLTPMTMMLGALSEPLKGILRQVPGGVAGTLVPFYQVTIIAVSACAASLTVALIAPLANADTAWYWIWLGASVPFALTFWAVIGCVQATSHLIGMVRKNERMIVLKAERDDLAAKRSA